MEVSQKKMITFAEDRQRLSPSPPAMVFSFPHSLTYNLLKINSASLLGNVRPSLSVIVTTHESLGDVVPVICKHNTGIWACFQLFSFT